MRDHSRHVEVNRDTAVNLLLEHARFLPALETISLDYAAGRVLAHDVKSLVDAPNVLSCKMDSVAVRWADFENGMPDTTGWQRGAQWQFANTGVAMPEGYDTAIVIENVVLSDDLSSISFTALPSQRYAGTSAVGSKLACGDVLARAGQVLTPLLMSGIASGNVRAVDVIARPKVAFIPTGNELVHRSAEIPLGKNIETNSILIAEKIRAWGGDPIVWDIVSDDPERIKDAVLEACNKADIVVLNAGSSKGSDDWNVEMLEEVGEVLYHQTNHGPGHHSSAAVVDGTVVVGISGPPGGASFTADFYVYPLVMKYFGRDSKLKTVQARLAAELPTHKSPKKADNASPKGVSTFGEVRPSVVEAGAEFFGVRQVRFAYAEDGVLEAWPAKSSHLSPLEAEEMDGYVMVSNLVPTPCVGDVITVNVRPR